MNKKNVIKEFKEKCILVDVKVTNVKKLNSWYLICNCWKDGNKYFMCTVAIDEDTFVIYSADSNIDGILYKINR